MQLLFFFFFFFFSVNEVPLLTPATEMRLYGNRQIIGID